MARHLEIAKNRDSFLFLLTALFFSFFFLFCFCFPFLFFGRSATGSFHFSYLSSSPPPSSSPFPIFFFFFFNFFFFFFFFNSVFLVCSRHGDGSCSSPLLLSLSFSFSSLLFLPSFLLLYGLNTPGWMALHSHLVFFSLFFPYYGFHFCLSYPLPYLQVDRNFEMARWTVER